jgi:hypothetical protein
MLYKTIGGALDQDRAWRLDLALELAELLSPGRVPALLLLFLGLRLSLEHLALELAELLSRGRVPALLLLILGLRLLLGPLVVAPTLAVRQQRLDPVLGWPRLVLVGVGSSLLAQNALLTACVWLCCFNGIFSKIMSSRRTLPSPATHTHLVPTPPHVLSVRRIRVAPPQHQRVRRLSARLYSLPLERGWQAFST